MERNQEKAIQYRIEKTENETSRLENLKQVDIQYNAKRPDRLLVKLGYDTNLAFDPIELYRVQGRMEDAEKAFRMEVLGRRASMGPHSKSYISQLSTLALLLSVQGDLEQAEIACREAAESSEFAYGADGDETISSLNYLARILFGRGKWAELEQLQLKLIPTKLNKKDIGPKDTTTLNSQNYLVVAYCFQGEYDKSIDVALKLAAFRSNHLGPEHQETLVTTFWLCRSLLEKGDFDGLETRVRDLVKLTIKACGDKSGATFERKELLAATLLGQSSYSHPVNKEILKEARGLISEILEACDADERANVSLFLRAKTTSICMMALHAEFNDAKKEIESCNARLDSIREITGPQKIEVKRLRGVEIEVKVLESLCRTDRELSNEASNCRKKLIHRWNL